MKVLRNPGPTRPVLKDEAAPPTSLRDEIVDRATKAVDALERMSELQLANEHLNRRLLSSPGLCKLISVISDPNFGSGDFQGVVNYGQWTDIDHPSLSDHLPNTVSLPLAISRGAPLIAPNSATVKSTQLTPEGKLEGHKPPYRDTDCTVWALRSSGGSARICQRTLRSTGSSVTTTFHEHLSDGLEDNVLAHMPAQVLLDGLLNFVDWMTILHSKANLFGDVGGAKIRDFTDAMKLFRSDMQGIFGVERPSPQDVVVSVQARASSETSEAAAKLKQPKGIPLIGSLISNLKRLVGGGKKPPQLPPPEGGGLKQLGSGRD